MDSVVDRWISYPRPAVFFRCKWCALGWFLRRYLFRTARMNNWTSGVARIRFDSPTFEALDSRNGSRAILEVWLWRHLWRVSVHSTVTLCQRWCHLKSCIKNLEVLSKFGASAPAPNLEPPLFHKSGVVGNTVCPGVSGCWFGTAYFQLLLADPIS